MTSKLTIHHLRKAFIMKLDTNGCKLWISEILLFLNILCNKSFDSCFCYCDIFKIIHIQILEQLFLSKSKIFGERYRREFSYFSSTKTSNHGRSNCATSLTYINQFNCENILYFIFSEKFFHKLIDSWSLIPYSL